MLSRRNFIQASSSSAASFGFYKRSSKARVSGIVLDDPDLLPEAEVFATASRAVDACLSLGASYADVRVIRNVGQSISHNRDDLVWARPMDGERIGIGVRALVGGCFGFASSPFVDVEEAAVLAKTAVEQGKANSRVRSRDMGWIVMPKQTGRWISPGKDPFLVPIEQRLDFINAWREEAKGYRDGLHSIQLLDSRIIFNRIEKLMVNSEGSQISQVLYSSQGGLGIVAVVKGQEPLSGPHPVFVKGLGRQQGGWEIFENANIQSQLPQMVERSVALSQIGVIPIDVGRYDMVFAGSFAGGLVSETWGRSTQLDLAVGYEANAGGTSYLGPDPMDFLGTQVSHKSISVRCDRSGVGKLATAKWDDEGVVSQTFDIVRDGVLVDYQTTRDTVGKVEDWYKKGSLDQMSRGCSYAQSGFHTPIQATPNLELVPNISSCSLTDMISNVKKGYIVYNGDVGVSFNVREGMGSPGLAREIRDGKLGDFAIGFQMMFNTPEIWKNIEGVGDVSTVERISARSSKGEPNQSFEYSVDSPAVLVRDVPVIDPMRKA